MPFPQARVLDMHLCFTPAPPPAPPVPVPVPIPIASPCAVPVLVLIWVLSIADGLQAAILQNLADFFAQYLDCSAEPVLTGKARASACR